MLTRRRLRPGSSGALRRGQFRAVGVMLVTMRGIEGLLERDSPLPCDREPVSPFCHHLLARKQSALDFNESLVCGARFDRCLDEGVRDRIMRDENKALRRIALQRCSWNGHDVLARADDDAELRAHAWPQLEFFV